MAYATAKDLYSRYDRQNIHFFAEKKTDIDENGNTTRTIDDVINTALNDASDQIDGYISGRVTLPVNKVPSVLVRTACVLAYYNLADNVATEKVEKDKDDALRYLEKVAQGQISLGLTEDKNQLDEVGDTAIITSAGSVWARKRSKGFI